MQKLKNKLNTIRINRLSQVVYVRYEWYFSEVHESVNTVPAKTQFKENVTRNVSRKLLEFRSLMNV